MTLKDIQRSFQSRLSFVRPISQKLYKLRPQLLKLFIRNHTRAFHWYVHYQWPWRYFKVIRLFHIKLLVNNALYAKSYYRVVIGYYTRAFNWCHFWWPWRTFEGHYRAMHLSAYARSWDRMSSVCLLICDHIGWKSRKLIARTISPAPSLLVAYSQGNMEKFGGDLRWGREKVACWRTKAAISLKRVKIEEKLLWTVYRKSPKSERKTI